MKSTFPGVFRLCAALALIVPFLPAQAPSSGPPAKTKETAAEPSPKFSSWKAFLAEAAQRNSLEVGDLSPWHMRATYKLYDDDGKPADEGVFEEYRASASKFRVSYKSPSYSHVVYGTGRADRAVYIEGVDGSSQRYPLVLLWGAMVKPLPEAKFLDLTDAEGTLVDGKLGRFNCVNLKVKASAGSTAPSGFPLARYCFEEGQTSLRFQSSPNTAEATNEVRVAVTNFAGRTIPSDLQIIRHQKLVLAVHLEVIEEVSNMDDGLFKQPPDTPLYPTMALPATVASPLAIGASTGATPSSMELIVSEQMAKEQLLEAPSPVYPPIAKAARISGTVVLKAVIAKDGAVRSLEAVSGPPMLQGAAVDAVKKWRYKPFRVAGKAVEVQTTVNVIFQLEQ
jgi:TonB family protein